MIRFLFLALFLTILSNYSSAAGFESGNLTEWQFGNGVSVIGTSNYSPGGIQWSVSPYETRMALITPIGSISFNDATSSLGLVQAENTAIRNMLTSQSQNGGGGNPNPTNAAWIKRDVTLIAGATYTFAWNYLSTDYTPFNDGSIITLVHQTDVSITPVLNNEQQRYALLGFTNPGTGNYSTGSYGSTGWQVATFTVPETGTYVLGFASFNLGDTALSPLLFIDEITGSITRNGEPFKPVDPNPGSSAPSATQPPATPIFSSSISQPQINTRSQAFSNTVGNMVDLMLIGSLNDVDIEQVSTGNYIFLQVLGNSNGVQVTQLGTALSRNFASINVDGSFNNITLFQDGISNKTAFLNIDGDANSFNVAQQGSGEHFLDLESIGDGHAVGILQEGSGNHSATLRLENGGGNWDFSLTQSGSTSQVHSIPHMLSDDTLVNGTCNSGTCQLTINQQ